MKTMFRNAVALLLLLPLLAGTLGISAKEHRCHSSNKTSIKLFPEFTGQAAGCCCSTDQPEQAAAGQPVETSLDAQSCCKTSRLYFVANFQTTQAQPELVLTVSAASVLHDQLSCTWPANILSDLYIPFFTDTGPPLTGRQRVICFHQSKIPCPAAHVS